MKSTSKMLLRTFLISKVMYVYRYVELVKLQAETLEKLNRDIMRLDRGPSRFAEIGS